MVTRTKVEAATTARDSVGEPRERTEDDRLLRGEARFVSNEYTSHGLHVAFVRSPVAHAVIESIDAGEASALDGVIGVYTGLDLEQHTAPGVIEHQDGPPLVMETIPTRRVRFAGDLVAVVVAESRYVAEDAAELVQVEYRPLRVHLDMFEAEKQVEDPVDPSMRSNLHTHKTSTHGDVAGAFAEAHTVVEAEFRSPRLTHVPIEPRGLAASWDIGKKELVVTTGQQTTHSARTKLAQRLRLRENQVVIVSPDVGGAFGQKIPLYREDIAVSALAMMLGRTVQWNEDRLENLMASNHARDDAVFVKAAVSADGRVLGMRAAIWADFGAYGYFPPSYISDVVAWVIPGPYRIENYEYTLNISLSNKCPSGTMRAPMAIATWVMEGVIQRVADELSLDTLEVKRRNILSLDDQPYENVCGYVYDSLSLRETLELAASSDAYARMSTWRSGSDTDTLRGLSVVSVLEPTTYGSAWYARALGAGSGHEAARVTIDPTGSVTVSVGINPSGQGYETSLAQVATDALGCSFDDVRVVLGDTRISPYGMGSRGSRGAVAGHGVVVGACQSLKERLVATARAVFDLDPSEVLVVAAGQILVRGEEQPICSIAEVARIAHLEPARLPPGLPPGLEVVHTYDPPEMTFSNATHVCAVEVEPRTGAVRVHDYAVFEDAGTVVNPLIVDGQIQGGVSMGVGHALMEEVLYDTIGNNLSSTFLTYHIPSVVDVPDVEIHHVCTPNPHTPLGMKGMSEGPVMGSVAAVALAAEDAIRAVQQGASVRELPLRPDRVLGLISGRTMRK